MKKMVWLFMAISIFGCHEHKTLSSVRMADYLLKRSIVSSATLEANKKNIECKLAVHKTQNNFYAVVRVTNRGHQKLKYYDFALPVDGKMIGANFEISKNGRDVDYMGKYVHFGGLNDKNADVLKPGESREGRFNLMPNYDISIPGKYTIKFCSLYFFYNEQAKEGADSNSVTLTVP